MNLKAYPKSTLQSFGIVGLVFVAMILFYPVQIALNDSIGLSPSFLIYYILAMGAPLMLMHFLKKKEEGSVKYLLKPNNIGVVLLLIVGTIALQWGVTSPIGTSIPMPEMFKQIFREMAEQMNDGYGLLTVAVMAPFFEEFIFRGVMLDGLLKRKSTWAAILIIAALFGLVHLNPWQFVAAMIIGTFAGWVYSRTKSLIYCMIIHFVNNFTASVFMYFNKDAASMDVELHEMYGGMTNMYVIIAASIVIAAICISMLNKHMKMKAADENSFQNLEIDKVEWLEGYQPSNKMKILRNIAAVVIGLVIGSIVNMYIIKLNGVLVPLPEGTDPNDMDSLQANMGQFSLLNYLVVFLAHSFGTLTGALVAGLIGASNKVILMYIIAFAFMVGGIIMVILLPTPIWFAFVDLAFSYIPVAWLVAKTVKK